MQNNQKQQRGISLLESLLVLVIIAAIIFTGLNRYKTYTQQKELEILEQNINTLLNNLDIYYARLAGNPTTNPICNKNIPVSNADLRKTRLWPDLVDTTLVANKNTDYVVSSSYVEIAAPPLLPATCIYSHNLIVRVTLDVPTSSITWYEQRLGANTANINTRTITWQKMPSYNVKGMGSDLWILSSELGVFQKALQSRS